MKRSNSYDDSKVRIEFPLGKGLLIEDITVFLEKGEELPNGNTWFTLGSLPPIGSPHSRFFLIQKDDTHWTFLRKVKKRPDKEVPVAKVTVL